MITEDVLLTSMFDGLVEFMMPECLLTRVFSGEDSRVRCYQIKPFILLPDKAVYRGGGDVPLVLLSDPAYSLLPWLIKAYGYLSSQQKLYNYSLSKARVIVEHAYGRLKGL